jgi:tripartite-type tricarboxylate transporter receptor subunit TctC
MVGFAPGQAIDIVTRIIGQRLSDRLGQQFIIENRPGAGGNIANRACGARAGGWLHAARHRLEQYD